MCIFSYEVQVSKTNIFAIPVGNSQQLTIYKNSVQFETNANPKFSTAMILPFPMNESQEFQILDLTKHEKFFKNLLAYFPEPVMKGMMNSRSLSANSYSTLKVETIGNYKCSVAKNFEDLQKVDSAEFGYDGKTTGLPIRIYKELEQYYKNGFGFLICKIINPAIFSPIGYIHPMVNDSLFVPTRHDHGEHSIPDWDHSIYVFGSINAVPMDFVSKQFLNDFCESSRTCDTYFSKNLETNEGNILLSKLDLPSDILNLLPKTMYKHLMRKYVIKGKQKNTDLQFYTPKVLKENECTYLIGKENYLVQPWFTCVTCNLQDGKGACQHCAATCHKGHELKLWETSEFFCDCYMTHMD